MTPRKFVIKCGNFAVLMDLHVMPLGSQEDASWFTSGHIEEVTSLVQDPLNQRIRQYTDILQGRRRFKQRRELPPTPTFLLRGENFNLVANFLKRHINLRCFVKQDLRLFPERYVVCVSAPEDALLRHRNSSLVVSEPAEPSSSEYFPAPGNNHNNVSSSMKTKRSILKKIVKQGVVQKMACGSTAASEHAHSRASPKQPGLDCQVGVSESISRSLLETPSEENHEVSYESSAAEPGAGVRTVPKKKQEVDNSRSDGVVINEPSSGSCQHDITRKTGKRCKPSESGEDHPLQRAKRTCLERPPYTTQSHFTELSARHYDPTPLLPVLRFEANGESKAFPDSESNETTVEVELLTPEKQNQSPPLTSKNTAQRNQNMPATSLRGLSLKTASTDASIGSRSTLGEEGSDNVPKVSRLRRQKRF